MIPESIAVDNRICQHEKEIKFITLPFVFLSSFDAFLEVIPLYLFSITEGCYKCI